jgi:RND family efflux transporter MFP subunit
MPLAHLVNLEKLRVSAQVSEAYLGMIRQGDLVELNFSSYPDLELEKPVSRLGEVIDAQTRTFTLEVELGNPREKLKPNMLTSLRIREFEEKEALVVPSIVLREDFRGTFLYLAREQDGTLRAEKRYVERGPTVQDRTMITSGLSAGDLLITRGFNLVSDGYPVSMISKD